MRKFAEKIFPEVLQWALSLSVGTRVVVFIYVLLLVVGVKFYNTSFLIEMPATMFYAKYVFITLLLLMTVIIAGVVIVRKRRKDYQVVAFARAWRIYSKLLFDLAIKCEPDRVSDKHWWDDEEHLKSIRDYHKQAAKIREMIFLIGERKLMLQPLSSWTKLCDRSEYINQEYFSSPFSLLCNLGNIVAVLNHYQQDIWDAIHISDEFIEYLSFKYNKVNSPWEK